MKKVLPFIFLLSAFNLNAQVTRLFTMTNAGGDDGIGTISSINSDGSGFQNLHMFHADIPGENICRQVLLFNNKMYATNAGGGNHNAGILFSYDTLTATYKRIKDFDITNSGGYPYGNLATVNNMIYGITPYGGAHSGGTIYRIDPQNDSVTKVFDVDTANSGYSCTGGFFLANDSNLYGLMSSGGPNNYGTIFRYDPQNNLLTDIYNFTDTLNGTYPDGLLMQASDGLLYGVTGYGGLYDGGVLFSFDIHTNTFTNIHSLGSMILGSHCLGGLVERNQKLYGITQYGTFAQGGAIFSYDMSIQNTALEYTIGGGANDNFHSGAFLTAGPGNNLYGTIIGSSGVHGKIFRYTPSNGNYSDLYYSQINILGSSLTFDGRGSLYGMGLLTRSVLYKFNIADSTSADIIDFEKAPDGSKPYGGFCKASNGKLYAVTQTGGIHETGAIISIDPLTGIFTKEHEMDSLNGIDCLSTMTEGPGGLLYFTCRRGGPTGDGTLLTFNYTNNVLSKLIDFGANQDPYWPTSTITFVQHYIYGTASYGGAFPNNGCVWKFDLNNQTLSTVYSFNNTDGFLATTGLCLMSNGKLYGTTTNGGTYLGTIFSIDTATEQFTKLYDFLLPTGCFPQGEMIDGLDGYLYGTAYSGGANNGGVIYRFDPATNSYSDIFDFTPAVNGSTPTGKIIIASNGNLMGNTYRGGSDNVGTIWSFDRGTSTINVLHTYHETDGALPVNASLTETGTVSTSVKVIADKSNSFSVYVNNSSHKMNLIISSDTEENNYYEIYSVTGKTIQSGNINLSAGINKIDIELGRMSTGVYNIKVPGRGGKLFFVN